MRTHIITAILSIIVVFAALVAADARAEGPPQSPSPRFVPVPKTPPSTAPHAPAAGPRPYYGEALGATYFNWGYFGAHRHAQLTTHRGYDNNYWQFGWSKGY